MVTVYLTTILSLSTYYYLIVRSPLTKEGI